MSPVLGLVASAAAGFAVEFVLENSHRLLDAISAAVEPAAYPLEPPEWLSAVHTCCNLDTKPITAEELEAAIRWGELIVTAGSTPPNPDPSSTV